MNISKKTILKFWTCLEVLTALIKQMFARVVTPRLSQDTVTCPRSPMVSCAFDSVHDAVIDLCMSHWARLDAAAAAVSKLAHKVSSESMINATTAFIHKRSP